MKIAINNRTRNKLATGIVKQTVKKFLKINKLSDQEISIALVGDSSIRKLNKRYRNIDKATDVLSFPDKFLPTGKRTELKEDNFLGELVLNLAQIKKQAPRFGNSFKQELRHICIHGLLHLLGHEDKTVQGRKKMDELTLNILTKIKL